MARLLVLGANGFIGKHLTRKLAQNSSNSIVAFDRFSDYKTTEINPFHEFSNVSIFSGDFSNRFDVLSAVQDIDYVFHLISTTNPTSSDKDPLIDIETNIKYTIELLESCVQTGVKKVIYPSSGGTVYGDIDSDSIGELTIPRPRSPYAIGKLTIENYLRYFKFKHGLEYVVYRIANPYGPGQNINGKQGVIPIFMNKLRHKESITIYGDGSMVRDYLYIDDLAEMISATYDRPNNYEEYNLGSGHGTSVMELIKLIERYSEHQFEINFTDQPASFVNKNVMDITRFNNEFSIFAITTLDAGMEKTWEYVKSINE